MKKRFWILISLIIMGLVITACSSDTSSTDSSTVENTDDVLIIGVDDQFPPLGYRNDDGEIVGFDIDLAKATAELMDMELVVQQIDWSAKELELSQGNIDAIWNGLTITEERKDNMLFTDPYLDNDQVVVVKADSGIKTVAELENRIVGLQKGSSAEEAFEAADVYSSVEDLVTYDENVSALQDLSIGRLDAVVVDSIVADWYIADTDSDFVVLEESLSPEEYGVAVAKDNTELQKKLNDALNEVKTNGTGAKISTEWFGKDILV